MNKGFQNTVPGGNVVSRGYNVRGDFNVLLIMFIHITHSIANVQLRASSFLSELVSNRDSRQSFLVASLSPKRNWSISLITSFQVSFILVSS